MNSDKQRTKTRVAAYLVGLRNNTILLGKRKNAVHMNGFWSLPAGHVMEEESALNAIIREAKEECNLDLLPNELKLVGAMHHLSPPYDYINFIFKADLRNHEPKNVEPHKCELLTFHPIDQLPEPMEAYIKDIITGTLASDTCRITEYGW